MPSRNNWDIVNLDICHESPQNLTSIVTSPERKMPTNKCVTGSFLTVDIGNNSCYERITSVYRDEERARGLPRNNQSNFYIYQWLCGVLAVVLVLSVACLVRKHYCCKRNSTQNGDENRKEPAKKSYSYNYAFATEEANEYYD